MIRKISILLFFSFCFSSMIKAAEDPKTLEIGAAAPDFNLKSTDGKMYSLKALHPQIFWLCYLPAITVPLPRPMKIVL